MLEIELKFRRPADAPLREKLAAAGAVPAGTRDERDTYFNAPDRDFAATGEAFRIRRIGANGVLTYKGPKHPGAVKTRTEIEVPLVAGDGPAAEILSLLVALGYNAVADVNKRRELFVVTRDGFNLTTSFDDIEGLGPFMEIEALAGDEQAAAAQQAVIAFALELGLTDQEPRSYLRMILAKS